MNPKAPILHLAVSLCGMTSLLLAGCSSGSDIYESTGVDGMETDSAVVQATPDGGYRTISGDPIVVMHGQAEQESMLPYGGGNEGLREAEDEDVTYMGNMGD